MKNILIRSVDNDVLQSQIDILNAMIAGMDSLSDEQVSALEGVTSILDKREVKSCRRKLKTQTFTQRLNDGTCPVEVPCKQIIKIAERDVVIHRPVKRHDGKPTISDRYWMASELSTGVCLFGVWVNTQAEAIAQARETIGRVGAEKFHSAIEHIAAKIKEQS